MATKILAFSGSSRADSINDKLLKMACNVAKDAGADVEHIQLKAYELPLYNQDIEAQGFPESASRLQHVFERHDALLLACPEYNSSITPLLKNTIDWVSRPNGESRPLQSFHGKTACLLSASPGALGGLRGLRHVREILSSINVFVVPGQFALGSAMTAFDDDMSRLADEKNNERLTGCVREFVAAASRLSKR